MRVRSFAKVPIGVLLVGLLLASEAARAETVDVFLGETSQDWTMYGQGPITTTWNGTTGSFGTYSIGQGAGSYNGTTSTYVLSGAITGSNLPSLSSGTYQFMTTYNGPLAPSTNAPQGITSAPLPDSNANLFNYYSFDPSTSMEVVLSLMGGGTYTIPLVTGGNFDGPGWGVSYVTSGCSGVIPAGGCDQANVGYTPGAIFSGPVTMEISFNVATPLPASWTMLIAGFAGLGFFAYRGTKNRSAARAAA